MSEQDSTIGTESEDDAELHRARRSTAASDEPSSEGESEEDVELHRARRVAAASDEPSSEGESDDDVELHASKSKKPL